MQDNTNKRSDVSDPGVPFMYVVLPLRENIKKTIWSACQGQYEPTIRTILA